MYLIEQFSILVLLFISDINHTEAVNKPGEVTYTAAATKNFRNVVHDYNLNPLHINVTAGQIDELKYTLYDIYLYNLEDCIVTLLKLDTHALNFIEQWDCPYFKIKFNNEMNGSFLGLDLTDQQGRMEIKTGVYEITMKASYTPTIKNNETFNIIYNPTLEANTKTHVYLENYTLNEGDQAQADQLKVNFNGKDQETGKKFVSKILEVLLMKYCDSLKDYLSKETIKVTLNNS